MSIVVNHDCAKQDIGKAREYNPNRKWYKFVMPLIPPAQRSERLLDVGGGAGEFTSYLRDLGYRTTLVDGNPTSVEREIDRGHSAYTEDFNVGLLNVADEDFDFAVCLEVIEHIVAAENLLREIHRVLKPGASLVLSTPNFSYFPARWRYLLGEDLAEEGYHFRFFTQRKLCETLETAGFSIEKRNSIGSLPGANFLLRTCSFGKLRFPHFRTPIMWEPALAGHFVYKAVRR